MCSSGTKQEKLEKNMAATTDMFFVYKLIVRLKLRNPDPKLPLPDLRLFELKIGTPIIRALETFTSIVSTFF